MASAPLLENHPLYKKWKLCLDLTKEFKESLHPKTVNTKKYYSDKIPSKVEINQLKAFITGFEKNVVAVLKAKKEIAKTPKVNGGTSLLKLKPEIAAFITLEKKGINDCTYSNTLLTQWFTNYFYVNQMPKGQFVIPNKPIIDLFHKEFLALGVIDEKSNLLQRSVKGEDVKGFKFIHLQKLFKNHIVTDPISGKRLTIETKDPKILDALATEKGFMKQIKEARHLVIAIKDEQKKLVENRARAYIFGDEDVIAAREQQLKKELNVAEKTLSKLCKEAKLPK